MKRSYLLILCLLLGGLCFTACSDDDKKGTNPPTDLTPDQIKDRIEEESLAFLKKIEGLSSNKGVQTLSYFSELFDEYEEPITGGGARASVTRAAEIIIASDFYGTYTWNDDEKEWIETDNDSELRFIFPSTSSSRTNDAIIVATAVDSKEIYDNNGEQYLLPSKVDATITVSGTKVASMSVDADWVSATVLPKLAKVNVDLVDYTMDMNVTKASPNRAAATLKAGSETIVEANATFHGDLDKLVNTQVIDNGNAALDIFLLSDLAFVGTMDIKAYNEAIDKLEEKYYEDDNDYVLGEVEAFNTNSNIVLNSRSDKTQLAKVVMRAKKDGSDYDSVFALQFSDDTTIDISVYFGTGFDDFWKEWNKFISSL